MDNNLQQTLEYVRIKYHNRERISEIWSDMHRLAEERYEPAIEFFISLLNDESWDWREEGISLLGFHYTFNPDSEIVNKFRQLLASDPASGVRIAAANAISSQSKWPEASLFTALKKEENPNVKRAIFGALLSQAGLPPFRILEEEKRLENEEILPTAEEIVSILRNAGVHLEIPD